MDENTIARFWSKVDVVGDDQCWRWKSGDRCSFWYDGKARPAHHVAWLIARGSLPTGDVLRACSTPLCCNPRHLVERLLPPVTVGARFGSLTVIALVPSAHGSKWPACLAQCDCGTPARHVLLQTLRSGEATSCGCNRRRRFAQMVRTHGLSGTPEHDIWTGMKGRCENPQNDAYADYGGRGIRVCDRWLDFDAFLADMGPRPSPRHSIDRKNNDGDYEPNNCHWATPSEQSRNTSRNVWIEYEGERMVATDWAARYGLPAPVLLSRIRRGWPIERALRERPRHYGRISSAHAS